MTSFPVDSTATLGRANTSSSTQPMAAAAPTRLGFSSSPRRTATSPGEISAPRRPMFWPAAAAAVTSTWSSPARTVSSTMTTASAPSGSGAPVAISAHVPGAMRVVVAAPV